MIRWKMICSQINFHPSDRDSFLIFCFKILKRNKKDTNSYQPSDIENETNGRTERMMQLDAGNQRQNEYGIIELRCCTFQNLAMGSIV